jgi:hypothetical protein
MNKTRDPLLTGIVWFVLVFGTLSFLVRFFVVTEDLSDVQGKLVFSLMAFVSLIVGVAQARAAGKANESVDPAGCEKCGYSLRFLTTPRCPECGAIFDPARVADAEAGLMPEVNNWFTRGCRRMGRRLGHRGRRLH